MHETNWPVSAVAMFLLVGCGSDPSPSVGDEGPDPRYEQMAVRAGEAPRQGTVHALVETAPTPFAEGVEVWVHPTDPAKSTVIVADKLEGLSLFGLDGQHVQDVSLGVVGAAGVDIRYGVPLGGERVSLVVAVNFGANLIRAFVADPDTGMLTSVISGDIPTGNLGLAEGSCLYQSPETDQLYLYVTSKEGLIVQHRLYDDGNGAITAEKVREIQVEGGDPVVEACAVDDALGLLYLAQEEEARILRYEAEPDGGNEGTLVDDVGDDELLNTEGIAIYGVGEAGGYLVVPMQGTWNYRVYTRDPSAHGGKNVYLGSFEVPDGNDVDGVMSTDTMALTNADLGGPFASGMLILQDRFNTLPGNDGDTNYKLVPWTPVAEALDLLVDRR